MELISTAINKDAEEQLLHRWIVGGYERVMSFLEFKKCLNNDTDNSKSFDNLTETEILSDVQSILKHKIYADPLHAQDAE